MLSRWQSNINYDYIDVPLLFSPQSPRKHSVILVLSKPTPSYSLVQLITYNVNVILILKWLKEDLLHKVHSETEGEFYSNPRFAENKTGEDQYN